MRSYSFLLCLVASPAFAQATPHARFADSSVSAIMRHFGARPAGSALITILRSNAGSYPAAKVNEIADSLAARAIANKATGTVDSARFGAAVSAVNALTEAGRSANNSQPYPGAMDRLIRIHQTAPVTLVQVRALCALPSLADRSRALAYLRGVAESRDATARDAIRCLVSDADGMANRPTPLSAAERQQSVAVLRELATSNRVLNELAKRELAMWVDTQSRRR